MQKTHFIGTDVSKQTLDFSVCYQGKIIYRQQVSNTKPAVKQLFSSFKNLPGFQLGNALCCMEHTGIYNNILLESLLETGCDICVEPALRIKQSQGMTRGKNDSVDADRIAQYAYIQRDHLKLWSPEKTEIKKLKHLIAMHSRLTHSMAQLATPVKENKNFIDKSLAKLEEKAFRSTLNVMKKDLKNIEKMIDILIEEHESLGKPYKLLTSIPGIGKITAINLLAVSSGFENFESPKQFACYAGIAPFKHESGSSIRGRTRVSHLANKKIKTLLHLAAMAAIKAQGELQQYYKRKVAEGKNRMSVLNAVRNKLIHIAFSVIKRQTPYEKKYLPTLA